MAHRVTLIPGDGTGPELTEGDTPGSRSDGCAVRVGHARSGRRRDGGSGHAAARGDARVGQDEQGRAEGSDHDADRHGLPLVNVALRHELGLYACLRPCKSYPGVRSPGTTTSTS